MNFKLFAIIFLYYFEPCQTNSRVKRIVGGLPADVPPQDEPVIFTRFNGRSSRIRGVRDYPHYVFKGIKFAYPPVGKERFLRPRQKPLEGEVNATNFAPPCVQPLPGTNRVIGNEDCLALNVFTPELPRGFEGLPVVVWIHGGGFRYGSASQYGVRHLVGQRLVVVTIQYRLGSLGFISTGSKQLPGNAALWDMVLAIQWVRNYIGFFGGNPYKIVVMGHGTGASSTLLVALSGVAKGLVSGVIAMSGTAISNWAVDNTPQNTLEEIADQNGCPTTSVLMMFKCLQNLSPEDIIKGDSNIEFHRLQSRGFMTGLTGKSGSAPVTEGFNDGRFLPGLIQDEPINDLNNKKNPRIPLLTGITKDETKRAVKGHLRQDIEHKLKTIPGFLNNDLVNNLGSLLQNNFHNGEQNIIGGHNNISSKLNFVNYLKLSRQSLHEALDKVSDVTNDVLFNAPAFLTVDKWSKNGAPTFLYSFEHIGKRKKGNCFLRGSPLLGNSTSLDESNDIVAHGDDLPYIFEVHDIEGKPLESQNNITLEDSIVSENFIKMIASFARHGNLRIEDKDVSPFSSNKNNFIQITTKPTLSNNFKFCEMALWCNLADRLKSSSCSFLKAFDKQVKNVQNVVYGSLKNTSANLQHNIKNLGQINPVNNFLTRENEGDIEMKTTNINKKTNKKPSIPVLGGLFK